MRSTASPSPTPSSASTATSASPAPAPAAAVVMSLGMRPARVIVRRRRLRSGGQVTALGDGGRCRDGDKPTESTDDVLGVAKGIFLDEMVGDNGVVLIGDQAAVNAAQATITLALPVENAGNLPHFAVDPPQKSRPAWRRCFGPLRHLGAIRVVAPFVGEWRNERIPSPPAHTTQSNGPACAPHGPHCTIQAGLSYPADGMTLRVCGIGYADFK